MYRITTDGPPHRLLIERGLTEAGIPFEREGDVLIVQDGGALARLPQHWTEGASIARAPRRPRSGVRPVARSPEAV